jgi:hypothetical protein
MECKIQEKETQIHGQQLNINRKMLLVGEYEMCGPLKE